jgi:hypothetical protein
MKRAIPLIVATTLLTSSAASAAIFYVTPRILGGVIIHIDGAINLGDDQQFDRIASRYPSATTIVEPNSSGGNVYSALLISAAIWDRGLSTWLANYDTCNSACAWIWFGGRRSVIQRNAEMCFHQPYNSKTGQTSPEVSEAIVGVLKHYGLTDYQARALVNAAPPESARCATEGWAFRLGFHPQIVPTPFAVRTCQSKFCLAVP